MQYLPLYTIEYRYELVKSGKRPGKPLVSYTLESVTITQSMEYRYERKTPSRRI